MKTRKGEVITRREIDVMGEEELLDLVRRHARLLGEQFPKQADRFYCPDILDESHLLRKLYRLDRERFVELVREQNKREYIAGGHWAAILISQGETLPEEVLRRQEQVMSKADAHCKLVLERLWNPGWPQRDFEEELKKVGLLISEAHPDWDSPKLAKLQRLALTRAMVCHYQWRAGELRSALAAAPKPEIFTALVWGVYQEDRLEKVFLLDGTGTAWGEDGAPFPLPDDAQVGLVVPAEMTKGQLALWKKRLKETGVKSPIRQLTIPPQLPEWGEFEGAVTRHITVYTVSGKWGLDMGALSRHCRADLLDPLHGYGARITFEAVWNGPEYNEEDVSVSDVTFYHMDPLPFEDYLPQRAVVPPEKLPARFVCLAGAAFRQLAGLK